MLENRIEQKLEKDIRKIGGRAMKFISPGMSGVPDRLVFMPGGRVYFVELKAPGERPRALQAYRAKELEKLGFESRCIDTMEKAKEFIEEVKLE